MLTSSNYTGLINQRFFQNLLPIPPQAQRLGQFTPDLALPDITHGRTLRLTNLRGKQPVVLAFTRIFTEHQYCPFCFPHILALNDAYHRFVEAGADLWLISSTDPQQSQQVVQDLGLKMPLLSDPSCGSFRRYGTGQALGAPLSAQFILDVQGRLRYYHRFSFLDHNASPETLLGFLRTLGESGSPWVQPS